MHLLSRSEGSGSVFCFAALSLRPVRDVSTVCMCATISGLRWSRTRLKARRASVDISCMHCCTPGLGWSSLLQSSAFSSSPSFFASSRWSPSPSSAGGGLEGAGGGSAAAGSSAVGASPSARCASSRWSAGPGSSRRGLKAAGAGAASERPRPKDTLAFQNFLVFVRPCNENYTLRQELQPTLNYNNTMKKKQSKLRPLPRPRNAYHCQ